MSFKNVPTYSYQRIFDIVWKGAKKQNFRKSVDLGTCKYRSVDGKRKCHIGHLIDDSEYRPSAELMPVRDLADLFGVDLSEAKLEFLAELQHDCHDMCRTPPEIEKKLRAFAKRHELTIPKG